MMMNLLADPFARGFFADEDLELSERVGMAIAEGAKYQYISFGKNILPHARASLAQGGAFFSYADSIQYDFGRLEEMVGKYPEQADELRAYADKFRVYYREAKEKPRTHEGAKMEDAHAIWGGGWSGHANPDFGMIVNIGTEGMRKKIEECAKRHPESDYMYRGCLYAMDALDTLGGRFRALAEKLAAECADEEDKKRYERAAKAFSVIPEKPAYDFESACHAFWMLFTFDGIDSPGRFDQFMQRAWELEQDRDIAQDALERLWECFHDTRTWNLCLSGSDENWNDETNSLTYAILRLAAKKKYQTPNITLRVHRNTPEKLWDAIADTLDSGVGMPALYNDEVVCAALEKIGIPVCDSHDYCMNGCNQIDIMGKSHMGLEDGEVMFAKCLEYTLHNGRNGLTGADEGLHTGDARKFGSYEELERAFMRQMEYMTHHACMLSNLAQEMRAMYSPNPLRSALIEGCLEKGVDFRSGGPLYGHGQILAEGIADTGDSLWAVKKLVFDEKKYTMDQLMDALEANFEGYEELRHDFASCEKFGNDHEGVDAITARFFNRFLTVLHRIHTYRGGVFTGGCSTFSRAASCGRDTAALPNGRRNRDELMADCIGAVPGCDVSGPTALIKSALKYNHVDCGSGFVFQVKFDRKLFVSEKGHQIFKTLAKTYFAQGGQQFTATVVSPEELTDAQINPDRHRDLIVRVGGYSDYFVNLEKGLQDNVIARSWMEA